MRKVLRVKVDDYHIRCGQRNSARHCPLALAITPMLPAGQYVNIGHGWWQVVESETHSILLECMDLPCAATEFVRRFDRGEQVEPFEFDAVMES